MSAVVKRLRVRPARRRLVEGALEAAVDVREEEVELVVAGGERGVVERVGLLAGHDRLLLAELLLALLQVLEQDVLVVGEQLRPQVG